MEGNFPILCCFLSFKSCPEYQVRAPNKTAMCSENVHSGYHGTSFGDRQITESDELVRTERARGEGRKQMVEPMGSNNCTWQEGPCELPFSLDN